MTLACAVALALLAGLAVLQLAVACGAPWGRLVWSGAHRTLPRRLRWASAASVVLYAGMAWILVDRASATPTEFSRVAAWVLFAFFCLGVAMNLASRSRAERAVMTPVCLVLAGATLVIAVG